MVEFLTTYKYGLLRTAKTGCFKFSPPVFVRPTVVKVCGYAAAELMEPHEAILT